MPGAPIGRGFAEALGWSKNVITTGVLQSVDRLRSEAPAQPRGFEGPTFRGSSKVLQVDIVSPGLDGFTIVLPGPPSVPWTCTLSLEANTSISGSLSIVPVLSGTTYPGNSWTGGSGAQYGTPPAARTFYGGDSITCAARVTGVDGETYTVTIDFAAFSNPGAR